MEIFLTISGFGTMVNQATAGYLIFCWGERLVNSQRIPQKFSRGRSVWHEMRG